MYTAKYDATRQAGSITLSSVTAEAERLRIKAVARGVLVTEACVAAIVQITRTGRTEGVTKEAQACANGAAAKKRGKMMPPGNFPAHANAMAISLATPTCRAALDPAKGTDGLTRAAVVSKAGKPCLVAAKLVLWPSTIHCNDPSPQNRVCG